MNSCHWEVCDFKASKTIDVIERNGLPKNSVALEPGDLEVDFVRFFPILLRTIFSIFRGGAATGTPKNSVAFEPGDLEMDFASYFAVLASLRRGRSHCPVSLKPRNGLMWAQDGPKWPQDGSKLLQDGLQDEL